MTTPATSSPTNVKTSIFYINDLHGQLPKMERITTAALNFDTFTKENNLDALKLSSGDIFIGQDPKRNAVAAAFLNTAGIEASTLGNHEFDLTIPLLNKALEQAKNTTYLGMNMNIPQNSPLSNKVVRSTVITQNGNKYGIIGIQPQGIAERIKGGDKILEGITIDDAAQTRKELQEEVDKLKAQGINKIILLSHSGYKLEKEIAQSVSGIDVILGGHSHDLIQDINEGVNLFYSPAGEPVVITQAGRDGNNFGILDLEYNDKGVIVKAQNNIEQTTDYRKNLIMSTMVDKILGPSPTVGQLKYADSFPKNLLIEENPYANFFNDAVRKETDSEIVLINSANIRGALQNGSVTERDFSSIFPFKNKLIKVKLSEKDLIDALNVGAKSLKTSDNKPGILQASGLTYTISKDGKVTEANFIDKNNQIHKIDVNNPNPNKKYITTYNNFLFEGGDGMPMLTQRNSVIEKYSYDTDQCGIDFIKKQNSQPFEIRKDGRVRIV